MKRYVIMTLAFVVMSCAAFGVPAKISVGASSTTAVDLTKKKTTIDTIKVRQRKLTKLVKPTGPPPKGTPSLPAPAKAPKAKKTKKDSTK